MRIARGSSTREEITPVSFGRGSGICGFGLTNLGCLGNTLAEYLNLEGPESCVESDGHGVVLVVS